ncbi:streptomycin 6-kinase [Amycolatopsis arida]|uniref:Streptomycin 6-kinase n=1 Tax=Amycolatopsis arida TaxID=587909 RepID=A0A1I5ZEM0_9PSEU|nr:aminoglycoside phosphotransferase family protein [Amycolatopsis arida]TDX89592.1 streptomycin 6-kinase [Amycolatopsis arida]SFQ54906.1 streptomycin 6-kinase [Amycolatopsis arida]
MTEGMAPGVPVLDDAARERLVDRFGPEVRAWCAELPDRLARLTHRWRLRVESALPGGTGRTFGGTDAGGRFVVLKLTPDPDIATTEATALRAWTGSGAAADLLAADPAEGALLLAGVRPGTPLAELPGRELPWPAVGALLTRLRAVRAPAGLGSLVERVDAMFALARRRGILESLALDPALLEASVAAARALAEDHAGRPALVHGDLHPGNVLDAGAGTVVAIDPRPCAGDPTFDAVDWAVLPVRDGGTLADGVAAVCRVAPAVDPNRLTRWCRAIAVLVAGAELRKHGRTPYVDTLLALAPR